MSDTFLNLLTMEDISHPDIGRRFGELIQKCTPGIFPDKIGNWEPIQEACVSPADFHRFWKWPVLAKRRNPSTTLSIWFRKPHRRYSAIYLDTKCGAVDTQDLTTLLGELAGLTNADFGMIQKVTPEYRTRAEEKRLLRFSDRMKKRYSLRLYDESLADGIPEAFDTMWLPAERWTIGDANLSTSVPGIFTLQETDPEGRDEVLKRIRRKN